MVLKTVNVIPMGKPRMTQRDKWKCRPIVLQYRTYCDEIRFQLTGNPRAKITAPEYNRINIIAYLPFPSSYNKAKRESLKGKFCCEKPDADNILKGVLDAIFTEDKQIAIQSIMKLWDDSLGARLYIELLHV